MVFSSFISSSVVSTGSFNTWPMDRIFVVNLFNSFNLSTVVLYFFAMEYKESPFWTVYVVSGVNGLGNFSNCPMDNVFDVRLFIFFISSTVVLLFWAIWYRVSPFWTV